MGGHGYGMSSYGRSWLWGLMVMGGHDYGRSLFGHVMVMKGHGFGRSCFDRLWLWWVMVMLWQVMVIAGNGY